MRFKGKVSWWFYGIMIGCAALLIPMTIVSGFVNPSIVALVVCLVSLLGIEGFCISIAVHNFVELQEEALLIVFGFIQKRIPYNDIVGISPTNDPSSSLAASLDRIEIRCRNQSSTMIAVIHKEGFLNQMKKILDKNRRH